MHMILIRPDLDKLDLVAFANLQTHIAQVVIDDRIKDDPSLLGWADDCDRQKRNVGLLWM